MTTLAAQNHRIRQAQAAEQRRERLVRLVVVAIGLFLFYAAFFTSNEPQCIDQGQIIDCSLLEG